MTAKKSTTQNATIEKLLRGTGKMLTSRQARDMHGIKNLRARVFELRNSGLIVQNELAPNGVNAYSINSRDHSGSRARIFK